MNLYTYTLLTIFITLTLSSQRAFCSNQNEESLLHKHFKALEARDFDDGWQDLSVGLIVKREETHSNSSLIRRETSKTQSARVLLRRDPLTGKISIPSTISSATQLFKRNVRHHAKRAMSVIITWYSGHDLLNPSCFQNNDGWAPTDDSLVGATTIEWDGKPECGQFVLIQAKKKKGRKGKKVTVRIADSCGGCASGVPHIDLTQKAFTSLYDLDIGSVSGLKARVVKAPVGHEWSQKDIDLYGPQHCS